MIGRAISHYRVVGTLGSGGMGIVYLAEDERLGRQVALKFLPAESVSSRQALDRFRVEARAASSLSHPGICAIYDIGEDDGAPYIVMEALRGESLRDRINRGPMKAVELLEIGIQLADALDAAHAQGIIHRDIKPSNIFVGDKNRAKILDFGLAKLAQAPAPPSGGTTTTRRLDASTQIELTLPGSALGTVSYMSPEQARGEDVDTRTDLFSLGVVLYEMATGVQAFGGSTPAVVFDAILNRTPPPITQLNPLIPARLEAVIAIALEKDRELRHQHASDLEAELKRTRRDLDSASLISMSRTTVATAAQPSPSASASVPQAAPAQPRSSWRGVAALSVAALGIAALGFYLWSGRSRAVEPPAATSAQSAPAPVTQKPPVATPAKPEPTPPPVTPTVQPPPATSSTAPAGRGAQTASTGRGTQLPLPSRPAPAEVRSPAPQPATPQRGQTEASQPTVTPGPPPASPSNAAVATPPPKENANAGAATTTPAPTPTPAAPAPEPPPVQPAPRTADRPAPPPAIPATSPVESDDTVIRRVIATYGRAIEMKSVDLFRSVRPALSAGEEARLRDSFRQVDSQKVEINIQDLRIEGKTATARLVRRDTFVTAGRRQMQSSQQTLRFEKTGAGWVISAIGQ